jgi:hypothetical protein
MGHTIGSSTLFEIKDHDLPINDFHILGDMNSSKGIITSDHNTLSISSTLSQQDVTYPMGRIGKHLQSLDSIRFEGAVEDQEPSKLEFTLDLISRSGVDLHLALFQPKNQ